MNKGLLFVAVATMATIGAMNAESNMVRIDSNKGFMFWGKKPIMVKAVYSKGEEGKVTEGVRQKSEFIFNDPKYGTLLRLEIKNPGRDSNPTIIEPKRGTEYKLKFDKGSRMWFVEKTERIH